MSPVFEYHLHLFSRFSPDLIEPLKQVESKNVNPSELLSQDDSKIVCENILKDNPERIVYYGIGLGDAYRALRPWLRSSKSHFLLFIEDDLDALRMFLESMQAESILKDKSVAILYLPPISNLSDLIDRLEQSKAMLIHLGFYFSFCASPTYAKKKANTIPTLHSHLIRFSHMVARASHALSSFSDEVHFYQNLLELDRFFATRDLGKNFSKFPTFIVGAGPSVNFQLEVLKKLDTIGIIFAAGTGMNVLNTRGVVADLGTGFDAHAGGGDRIKANHAFMTPYFVDINCVHEGVKYLQGPLLLTSYSHSLIWHQQILDELNITSQLETFGWVISSTQYALEVSCAAGFNPIVFVGVDLSFKKGSEYGIECNWLNFENRQDRKDLFLVESSDQNIVTTTATLYSEASSLSLRAKTHPEIQFYNASNGLNIPDIQAIDLDSFCDMEKFPPRDVLSELHACIFMQPKIVYKKTDLKNALMARKKTLENHSNESAFKHYSSQFDLLQKLELDYLETLKVELSEEYIKQEKNRLEGERASFFKKVLDLHIFAIEETLEALEDQDVPIKSYPKGAPEVALQIVNGKLEGRTKVLAPEGTCLAEGNFKNGVRDGIQKLFYRSGAIYSNQRFELGLREGIHEYFYESGQLMSLLIYKKGLLDGPVKIYFPNGILKNESEFKEGLRDGVLRLYSKKGVLLEEGFFKEGFPVATHRKWNQKGDLIFNHLMIDPFDIAKKTKESLDMLFEEES